MTDTKPIHTLNARGHLMLEVMRDYFELSSVQMQREIQGLRLRVEEVLSKKGISYDKLKSALVPDRKRREIALVFDTSAIESSWYGYEIFEHILPLLDKQANHSILCGDYLDRPGQADQIFAAFEQAVLLMCSVEYRHPTQFFIVYINNLTAVMIDALLSGLSSYEPFVGYADTTYASMFKFYLSTMLINLCVKHGTSIIQGHEPDRDDGEDVNVSSYPFEKYGYTCRSINSDLMGVLLSYKIERPVLPGFEVDTEFGLNAISSFPLPLDEFEIEVLEAKLNYVKANKAGSIERAGLESITTDKLAQLIRSKISASYIYNLEFLHEFNVAKFSIILELPSITGEPVRLLAALEYKPEVKSLKLLTLF